MTDLDNDPVAISLGLVAGKSWPEDAGPGPHYWRVPTDDGAYMVHMVDCHHARRSAKRRPWFWADGMLPFRLIARMRHLPEYTPCRVCWYWQLRTVEVLGLGAALIMTRVAEAECK